MAKEAASAITVNGCRVSLRRKGDGAPMVYLHGAGGAGAWLPFMERLAGRFDLLVPEHPGFGASETPDWLDNIHDLAYFYLDFLAALELTGVHLVGSSIGGWVALEIAVRDTSRIATLTLSAPAGIHVDGVERGDLFVWSPEETMRRLVADPALAEEMASRTPTDEEIDAALKNRRASARLAWSPRLHDPHLPKWLHRIDVPTRIIWGSEDRLLPAAYADAYRDLIPGADVTVIDGCGHLPQIERTDDFCRTVIQSTGELVP